MREIYRNSEQELERFRKNADYYLYIRTPRKSMGELCEFLGITRQTLSKYKQRNYLWRREIQDIKDNIVLLNFLKLKGLCETDKLELKDI